MYAADRSSNLPLDGFGEITATALYEEVRIITVFSIFIDSFKTVRFELSLQTRICSIKSRRAR